MKWRRPSANNTPPIMKGVTKMTLSEKQIKLLKEAWQALDYSMIEEDENVKAEMIKKAMDNIRSLF